MTKTIGDTIERLDSLEKNKRKMKKKEGKEYGSISGFEI